MIGGRAGSQNTGPENAPKEILSALRFCDSFGEFVYSLRMYVCMHACMYVCMYIYIYKYIAHIRVGHFQPL